MKITLNKDYQKFNHEKQLFNIIKRANHLATKKPHQVAKTYDLTLDTNMFNNVSSYHDLDFIPGYRLYDQLLEFKNEMQSDIKYLTNHKMNEESKDITLSKNELADYNEKLDITKWLDHIINKLNQKYHNKLDHLYFNDVCFDTYSFNDDILEPLTYKEILTRLCSFVRNNPTIEYISSNDKDNHADSINVYDSPVKLQLKHQDEIKITTINYDDINRTNQWWN